MRRVAGAWLFGFLFATVSNAQAPVVRIGVVIDGPWERNAEVERLFQSEILELTGGEFDVRFPTEARLVGDWTVPVVDAHLDRLLSDPEIDVVMAMGIIASDRALYRRGVEKPLLAPFVIDAELQGAPRDAGVSGVSNLSYLASSITIRRDLEVFQELHPFETLVILHGPALNDVPGIRARLTEVVSDFDVEVTLVEVRERAAEALPQIPEDTQAVFVNPLLQLEEGELEILARGLIGDRAAEQRIRSALHRAGASYAGIQLARAAAAASRRSLELVTDSYSVGAVSIIELLDAQNAAVLSREAEANAVYEFLIDMLEVERSMGRFYFDVAPAEIDGLFERVDLVFRERGREPPPRRE